MRPSRLLCLLLGLAIVSPAGALTPGQRIILLSSRLDPATSAWVNAVKAAGGSVSTAQQARVNKLIIDLKTEYTTNYFATCDRIWLHAAENTQQATVDIVADSAATNHGATFASNTGFTGNGSSQYLDTGYASGSNFAQNSATVAVYLSNNRTVAAGVLEIGRNNGTNYDFFGALFSGSNSDYLINSSGASGGGTVTTTKGFWLITRTASNLTSQYENGSSTALNTSPTASTGVPSAVDFFLLAQNGNGTAGNFSADTIANSDVCAGMTGVQSAQFQNIINNDYMKPLGINVY
jgi:hypothetical protein